MRATENCNIQNVEFLQHMRGRTIITKNKRHYDLHMYILFTYKRRANSDGMYDVTEHQMIQQYN